MLGARLPHNLVALGQSLGIALSYMGAVKLLAHKKVISAHDSRKATHIGMGLLYMSTWRLYDASQAARWVSASIPIAITGQVGLVGLGVLEDEAAVQAMSRTGRREELLQGPLVYGAVHLAGTLLCWLQRPHAMVALSALCAGDGLAEVVGRRVGRHKLPWSARKSWEGSAACVAGAYAASNALLRWNRCMPESLSPWAVQARLLGVAVAAAAAESLDSSHFDNLTTTGAAALASLALLR